MNKLVLACGLVLITAIGSIAFMLRQDKAPLPNPQGVVEAPAAPRPPPLPPTVDVRPQVRQAVAEAKPTLHSPRDVEQYLTDLEAQARRKHQVTALEVEPALAAIRSQYPPEEAQKRTAEYTRRMAELSAELDGRKLE